MALGRAWAVAVAGIDGQVVEIEADIGGGLPGVKMVGLPDTALQESRDRVRAAVSNSGAKWPDSKVVLALSPATLPKVGSVYDVGLACAVLNAANVVPLEALEKTILIGELALDGRLRPVRGVLPAVLTAKNHGWHRIVVPAATMGEAALVDGLDVYGAETLADLVRWLQGDGPLERPEEYRPPPRTTRGDLSDVVGQSEARRALEVAAAGAHHLMLTGSPGVGKTMLAQRLPGILPDLTEEHALEVTAIHSVAGTLAPDRPLVTEAPFIAPHHTATVSSLIGGGTGLAKPGAVSRAHRGVLFLDEVAEMSTKTLEALRTPLEDGEVRVARRDGIARYPARFQLILAANPCPCAPARDADCVCAPTARRRYLGRLSGPLLDRVDLRVRMTSVSTSALMGDSGESTGDVRARVSAARAAAAERWSAHGWATNAEVPGPALRQKFRLAPAALAPLERALRKGAVTARGADRALRVAWSVCDLDGATSPSQLHVATALDFRDRGSV